MNVVLDPGHGGTAKVGGSSPNNAVGPGGLLEKSVTLEVAIAAQGYLVGLNVECILTRQSDVNVGLADRAYVARDLNADAFVSIHLNASDPHTAQGTETWIYTGANAWSRSLAATVQAGVLGATVERRDRGVKLGTFKVLNPAYHAARTGVCLVEMSFMDTVAEERRLREAAYKDGLARALAVAVHGWLLASDRDRLDALFEDDEGALWTPEDGFEVVNGPLASRSGNGTRRLKRARRVRQGKAQ